MAAQEEEKHLDPFVMTLNHGETFGIFDRHGDIINIGKTPQGIFFEGSRHISCMAFELNGTKPLLLSSTIREDNDSLTIDMANSAMTCGERQVQDSTVYVRKLKRIRNEGFSETLSFKNFNSFALKLTCSIRFEADFKDVFELRGFHCETCALAPKTELDSGKLHFRYLGRDGIQRLSLIHCDDVNTRIEKDSLVYEVELKPGESKEFEFYVGFERSVPEDKLHLFEGELNRKPVSISALKKELPIIHSSNAHFNHWILRSTLDLLALTSCYGENLYPMAGVPWYNTPFGRDGLITCYQTLFAAPFLTKNVLLFLAHYQSAKDDANSDAEPGKILHELRKGELANIGALPFKKYYGAVDSTFLFIWLTGIYYFRTGDSATLDAIWPAFERALDWAQEFADLDGDGFFEYEKRNPVGLDNQCWKDSWDSISHRDGRLARAPLALVEVQGYAYKAFMCAKKLYELKGRVDKAVGYLNKAVKLKKKFNESFWMEEFGFYALALDASKNPCRVLSSNAGHVLATGIADEEKASLVGKKLFEEELFSGWGIRTLGSAEERYNPMSYHNGSIWPHDNSMIALGLKKYGQINRFHQLAQAMFDTAVNMENMRLPELFCGFGKSANESPTLYPVSCSPQAWASGSVFLLINSMLGIKVRALAKSVSFDRPSLPDYLEWIVIKELPLGDGGHISFKAKRVSSKEATIEILSRPDEWKVSINM